MSCSMMCSSCLASHEVPDGVDGRHMLCEKCRAGFLIPEPAVEEAEAPEPRAVAGGQGLGNGSFPAPALPAAGAGRGRWRNGALFLWLGGATAGLFVVGLVIGWFLPPTSASKAGASPTAAGLAPSGSAKELPAEFNLAEARRSVVFVKRLTPGEQPVVGSGFLASADGLVYTNRHVIQDDGANRDSVLLVGVPSAWDPDELDYFKAEVAYRGEAKDALDFAVLKVAAQPDYGAFKPLPVSFDRVGLGGRVAALGYPHIKDDWPVLSFNKGNVSAARVLFDGRAFYQTDAAVNPGNSGGPLVNARGEAVGIVTLRKANANNMGYALYLSELKGVAAVLPSQVTSVRPEPGPLDPSQLPTVSASRPRTNPREIVRSPSPKEGTSWWRKLPHPPLHGSRGPGSGHRHH